MRFFLVFSSSHQGYRGKIFAQQFGASDGCNYVNSGFEASINLNELTKGKRYEVVVLYMNNDNLLLHPTNIWIEI